MKTLSKFYFITQSTERYTHLELIEKVLKSGCRLVQLRMKDSTEEEVYQTAQKAQLLCNRYNATFILNDYLEIAYDLNLDGVHLGKEDVSPLTARQRLGEHKIVGGTANTQEDVEMLLASQVDYIGLGPFRKTETKKNLSPLLGIKGYQNILQNVKVNIPIYAIGGIEEEDIKEILKTGVYGVAVSGMIYRAQDVEEKAKRVSQLLG